MKYLTDRHPEPGELCTVCDSSLHKRAALLFDRVYVAPSEEDRENFDVPQELTFGFSDGDQHVLAAFEEIMDQLPPAERHSGFMMHVKRALSRAYARTGCVVIPSFTSYTAFDEEFREGREIAFEGALKNVKVVDAEQLNWEHIVEFRRDTESLRKYRDLRLWLQTGLKAATPSEAADQIGAKLDSYEWALRKHGFATIQGAITFLLDYKQAGISGAAAAAGAAFGGPVASALAGGVVIASQVTAWALARLIEREDVKRGADCEVAFIHDINGRFGDR